MGLNQVFKDAQESGQSSPALVKLSGQVGSSDTNHIVLGYADKFVEGVLSAAIVEGGMQMGNSAMGCCCRVQSLFLPW